MTFAKAVLEAFVRNPGANKLIINGIGLKPQREAGEKAFAQVMGSLGRLGVVRASVITNSSLTKLQLMRIARECAPKNVVEFN